jgi:high-affinity iron transporter
VASLVLATTASGQADAPWAAAADVRLALSEAETELVLGSAPTADARVDEARAAAEVVLASRPAELRAALAALERADRAVAETDERAFAVARAKVWTAILKASFAETLAATRRGNVEAARSWLLVREFRPPTRFSRAAADATLALDQLQAGTLGKAAAAAAIRNDLLDTYEGRIRSALAAVRESALAGFDVREAESAAAVAGYWAILRPAYRAQRGAANARQADSAFDALAQETGTGTAAAAHRGAAERALEGFRAAPLSEEEQLRRAGQMERFLKLVPIEYGRGVKDGKVALDFEIQEAITFRDGAAGALADLVCILLARDAAGTPKVGAGFT